MLLATTDFDNSDHFTGSKFLGDLIDRKIDKLLYLPASYWGIINLGWKLGDFYLLQVEKELPNTL